MGGLKTLFAALSLAAATAGPLRAGQDMHWTFADCAGRLSALMEHQWLMGDPRADQTKAQRAAMIGLMEATMPPHEGREVLARRIEAKQAQAVLLTRATFNRDSADADWALRRAEMQISACVGLLLS